MHTCFGPSGSHLCSLLLPPLTASVWGSELLIVPQVRISNLCGEKPQGLWEEEAPGPAHPSRSVTGKAALGGCGISHLLPD